MRYMLCAWMAAAALAAGCSTNSMGPDGSHTSASGAAGTGTTSSSPSFSPSANMSETEFNRMCQVFKGFRSRGGASDEYLQESCTRQLGADGCRRCLAGS